MLIEFQCEHDLNFDDATGEKIVCGQRMSASTDDVGLLVTCPRCGNDCEVPKQVSNSKSPADAAKKATRRKRTRCPKCGGDLSKRGVCSACRWVEPRFVKKEQTLEEMDMEPAGMMLWLAQILSEGIPMKVLAVFSHVVFTVFCVSMIALAVIAVGGITGGLLLIFAFALLVFYWALAFKSYQFLRDGNAQLAWFQKPFWHGILAICRHFKWQGLDAKTKNRNVVDFRGKPVTDAMLLQAAELKTAQVLDLEGTLITDAAVERLYQLKYLQCLVLKETKVSHLAVTRLQQSFPKLWIWY